MPALRPPALSPTPVPPPFPPVTESLNSRVVWFSVLELVTVVTVAYWQLRSLKSFFEVKASV